MDRKRQAGLLIHPTSLPGANGIGELGDYAFKLLDWIKSCGFSVWQVLPLGPTGFGDSPYQCFSAFAGNPYLISLDKLVAEGLLKENDLDKLHKLPDGSVNYGVVIPEKLRLLDIAFQSWRNFSNSESKAEFERFCEEENFWLDDFTLFTALKEANNGQSWNTWKAEQRDRSAEAMEKARNDYSDTIAKQKWMQFVFQKQWLAIRTYATELKIEIMGDMPLFVAFDSADAWANPELFHLDDNGNPTVVAGVPPDYFSETGQRWGNPLYKWEVHESQSYKWWRQRLETSLKLVDMVRIDHFRGLYNYWEIPATEPTAVNGRWVMGPGEKFFNSLLDQMGHLPLIAEDLGEFEQGVQDLRKKFDLPGMKIMQFAWSGGADNPFLPHNHEIDSVVYTGTHDNNTSVGWWSEEATEREKDHIREYLDIHDLGHINTRLMRMAYASVAYLAVIPMQDLLGLGSDCKMNRPGVESGNWGWRMQEFNFNLDHANWLKFIHKLYDRLPKESDSK